MARAALLAAAAVLLGLVAADRLGAVRAKAAVRELENSDAHNIPKVIEHLDSYRRWANPLLRQTIDDVATDPRSKDRSRLALLPVDRSQAGALLGPLIDGDPDLFLVIRQALCDHGDRSALANECRELLANERENPDRRLRAGMALAGLLGESLACKDDGLRGASGFLAKHFINDLVAHPDRYNDWLAAMQPGRACLVPALEAIFRDAGGSDSARSSAASVLAKFAADDPDVLTGLLLDANERQFGVIFDALPGLHETVAARLMSLLRSSPSAAATREEKSELAKRQANAAIAVVRLGSAGLLWPLLAASENPDLRSFLIDRLGPMRCPPAILLERLAGESDSSIRAALLLSLGRYTGEQIPPNERGRLAPRLLALYRDDPDPAVHSAAGWLVKTWGHREQLRLVDQDLATGRRVGSRRWYICPDGLTMVLLDGKQNYVIGTPELVPGRKNIEPECTVDVAPFEISTTEVTVDQYRPFLKHDANVLAHYPAESLAIPDCPQLYVTWCEAAHYCNWRSQQEGIPQEEWCYEPRADDKYLPGMKIKANFQSKVGYRLPTEEEWEYACRAGTVTRFLFGDSHELIGRYARCAALSAVPVGSFFPNAFGLFDTHGNAFEWCQNIFGHPSDIVPGGAEIIDEDVHKANRGGGFFTRPPRAWSAMRYKDSPLLRNDAGGFRLVRSRPRSTSS